MIPCENCILLAICKANISIDPNHYECYILPMSILMDSCSILRNYLKIKRYHYSVLKTYKVFHFLTQTNPHYTREVL